LPENIEVPAKFQSLCMGGFNCPQSSLHNRCHGWFKL